MPKIKFAIFDVGQTIYPYTLAPLNTLMFQQTEDKEAFSKGHTAFNYNYNPYMKGEQKHKEFVQDLCRFCFVSYNSKIQQYIEDALRQGRGNAFAETLTAMQQFKTHNIEIGILSNALPLLGDTKTEFAKPEYIFTSYKLGLLKPDIKIYQALSQKLQTPYNQILFIDDKERNITPAQSLGIHGIVYTPTTILNDIVPYLL